MTEGRNEPVAKPTSVDLMTLRQLAEVDIAYEMKQYTTWAARGPSTAFLDEEEASLLKKATFEVRVLHLRNLADFLRKDRPDTSNPDHSHRLTDVVAAHYFDDGWMAKPQGMRCYSAQSRKRDDWVLRNINAHLAHVTRTRVDRRLAGEEFDWDQVDSTLVLNNFDRFITDLQRAHPDRAQWFESCRTDIKVMRASLASPVGPPPETTTSSGLAFTTGHFARPLPLPATTSGTVEASSTDWQLGDL